MLTKAGFKRGKYNPSTYYLEKVCIKAMVHGDDFISSGSRKSLRWFRQVLESRFEVSTVVVGDGREEEEVHETKVQPAESYLATPTPTGLAAGRQPGARAVGLSSGDDTPSRHGPPPRKT